MKGKRIMLFKRILAEIENKGPEAVDVVAAVAPIIGEIQDSLEFQQRCTEPVCSIRQFLEGARAVQEMARCRTSGDRHFDLEVWATTLREVQVDKWQKGPVTEEELNAKYRNRGCWLGTTASVSRARSGRLMIFGMRP